MYTDGLGVPQNDGEAVKWYRKAADQGDPDAQASIKYIYAKSQDKDCGNAPILATTEPARAVAACRSRADEGNTDAQVMLGLLYSRGQGVAQDYTEAAKWWRKAADQNDNFGQLLLGRLYAHGKGVPQDYVQAYIWLSLSAARGTPYAPNGPRLCRPTDDPCADRACQGPRRRVEADDGTIAPRNPAAG